MHKHRNKINYNKHKIPQKIKIKTIKNRNIQERKPNFMNKKKPPITTNFQKIQNTAKTNTTKNQTQEKDIIIFNLQKIFITKKKTNKSTKNIAK